MRSLHVLQPDKPICQTLQAFDQLRLNVFPLALREVIPDLNTILHIKKQVALAEVPTVTLLMLEEVLLQPRHIIVLIRDLLIDEFLDLLMF